MNEHPLLPARDGEEAPTPAEQDKWLRVDLRGDNHALWAGLREKLIARIQAVLEGTANYRCGSTVREELQQFTAALLDFAKAKLAMPVAEIQKIGADIAKAYAEEQERLANAEKTREEARAIRIANDVKELRLTLGMTKAILVGEKGKEALLLGKQIDALLKVFRELAGPAEGLAIASE